MRYMCPVCGYNNLLEPPEDYMICPSCGTEFGNDDTLFTLDELRLNWIKQGMPWFSHYTHPPVYWNPSKQLSNLGYGVVRPANSNKDYSVNVQGVIVNVDFITVSLDSITNNLFGIRLQNA